MAARYAHSYARRAFSRHAAMSVQDVFFFTPLSQREVFYMAWL